MTIRRLLRLGCLFILLSAFQCDAQDDKDCDEKSSELAVLQTTILNLVETTVCNENFECRSIAFGSKPCGGPWQYLVYSTSIDTLKLTTLVARYSQLEAVMNTECGLISNCALVTPPQKLECLNNTCIAIY